MKKGLTTFPNGDDSIKITKTIPPPSRKQNKKVQEVFRDKKMVYLIRHGQSKAQATKKSQRKNDPDLLDCGLTTKGYNQAIGIRDYFLTSQDDVVSSSPPDLIVSSPLTRALHTAVLGFSNNNILVHYDLRELGSQIPENLPRPMTQVLKDLKKDIRSNNITVDVESLQPSTWPPPNNGPKQGKNKKDQLEKSSIQEAMQWLYQERPEQRIAIVCHYNVIRSLLGASIHPENAVPIPCWMTPEGVVVPMDKS